MTSPNRTTSTDNISLGNNPFIWGHIALIAGVPWLLALTMAGLAVGDPVFPAWFEIFLLGFPAIALVTWVQWQQPISPFSLWFVTKPTESLSDRDRQILTLVKQNQNGWYVTGWIATAVAIVISAIFCKIYIAAPLAQVIAPFPAGLRLFGIIWAEVCFLLSNVLLQAGISALRIKLTAESELTSLQPFAVEKIKNSFTSIGWRSPQLLKFFEEDAIAQNDLPQVEATPEFPEAQASPEAEESEPSNLVTEVEPEEIKSETISELADIEPETITSESISEPTDTDLDQELEINDLVEEVVSENEAIADATEPQTLEPIEIVLDSEFDAALEPTDIISEIGAEQISEESQIETTIEEAIVQEPEKLEPIELIEGNAVETFLDIPDTSSEINLEESAMDEPDAVTEFSDPNLDNNFVEEVEELEISAIAAEESVLELVLEPETSESKTEQFTEQVIEEEHQIETILDDEITQESEELEPVGLIEEIAVEPEPFLDTVTEPEIEESAISETETNLDLSDINLDKQVPDEVEELEISELVADESIAAVTSESEPEQIIEATEDLDPVNTPEKTDSTFLDISDTSSEQKLEETEQAEANLEPFDHVLTEETVEDDKNFETVEESEVEDSEADVFDNTSLTSSEKRDLDLDFFKKSRKTGTVSKKLGFGKSVKRDSSDVISTPETTEPEDPDLIQTPTIAESLIEESVVEPDLNDPIEAPEIFNELEEDPHLEAIALPIDQDLAVPETQTQDFDDELDELIAFNMYVENILKEYLADTDEETESVAEVVETSESTAIAEQGLVEEESWDEDISEPVDPSIVFDPTLEMINIAQENVEAFAENLPELDTQIPEESPVEIATDSDVQETKDPKYLVQEFLVDKFLARLEELNIADKANKANIEPTTENISEPNPEVDEFADLEALLDRKLSPENPDTGDLSDRNS
jgi:hypothetical protein